jgi:hypothetical protein
MVEIFAGAGNATVDAEILTQGGDVTGDAATTDAGSGGPVSITAVEGDAILNGAEIETDGGSVPGLGSTGNAGSAGDVTVLATSEIDPPTAGLDVELTGGFIHARGGSAVGGAAGEGGAVEITALTGNVYGVGGAAFATTPVETQGGDSETGPGGDGGNVSVVAGVLIQWDAPVTTSGGSSTDLLSAADAGDAGDVTFTGTAASVELDPLAVILAVGGNAADGQAGDGGDTTITAGTFVNSEPPITTRGGNATGLGNAGSGGMVMITAAAGDVLLNEDDDAAAGTVDEILIDTRGGSAVDGLGGAGGDVMISATAGRVEIGDETSGDGTRVDIDTSGGSTMPTAPALPTPETGGTAGDISVIATRNPAGGVPDIRLNGDLTALPGNDGAGTGFIALVVNEPSGDGIRIDADDPITTEDTPRLHAGDFILMDAGGATVDMFSDNVRLVAKENTDAEAIAKLDAKGVDTTGLLDDPAAGTRGDKGIKIRNADQVLVQALDPATNPDPNDPLQVAPVWLAEDGAISVIENVGRISVQAPAGGNEFRTDGNGDFYTELAPVVENASAPPALYRIEDEGSVFVGVDPQTGQSFADDAGGPIFNDLQIVVDDDGDGANQLNLAGGVTSEEGDLFFGGTDVNDDMAFGGDVVAQVGNVEFDDFGTARFAAAQGTTQTVAAGGNVTFNSPDANPLGQRPTVPRIATVARAFPGDLDVIAGNDVRFGHNEKVSVPGDLLVNAGDDIAIGDVAALNVLVNAGDQITINTRAEGQVEVRGGGFESDEGVDIVGNTIVYNAPGGIAKSGQGNNQVLIGTPTAFTEGGELNAQLLAFVENGQFQIAQIHPDGRQLAAGDFFRSGAPGDIPANANQGFRRIDSSVVLDIVPIGPARGNVGENFAGVVAATTAGPDGGTNQAAVSAAPLRENTLLSFLECGSDEDVDPKEVQECQETAVGDARANSEEARAATTAYDELFGTYDIRATRVAQRQQELEAALVAGDVDAPVLATIRRLFDAADAMGMSEQSMANFQIAVLTAVRPADRSMEEVWELLAASY